MTTTWSAQITVTDCPNGQPLQATAIALNEDKNAPPFTGVWATNAQGVIDADGVPDYFTQLEIEVDNSAYVVAKVTVSPNDNQAICLTPLPPPPPPPAEYNPPAITSYYVQAGVLTVDYSSEYDYSSF